LMMNPVPWLQMTNMISYQGLVRTFPCTLNKTARNQGKDNPHSGSCEPFNYFYFQRWFGLYIFFLMDSSSVFK
ncbi:hypothetical protein QU846_22270, partial [Escherichia coli]|nr:hypothetical protein [Escherichia coli]MDM8863320.1 hypothetical protein [Escherichia coli]MDM8868186.1 hypothetical protein [Escherichia coli]